MEPIVPLRGISRSWVIEGLTSLAGPTNTERATSLSNSRRYAPHVRSPLATCDSAAQVIRAEEIVDDKPIEHPRRRPHDLPQVLLGLGILPIEPLKRTCLTYTQATSRYSGDASDHVDILMRNQSRTNISCECGTTCPPR